MNVDSKQAIQKRVTTILDLVVGLTVLFFLTQTLDAFNFPKALVLSTGIFALVLALQVHSGYPGRVQSIKPIEFGIISTCVVFVLVSITSDLNSFTTIWGNFGRANGLLVKLPLLILVALYFRFGNDESVDRFFKLCFSLLCVEILYGFMQIYGFDIAPWINPYGSIFVTAGNPNFAAALFAILTVVSSRYLILSSGYVMKIIAGLVMLLGVFMSLETKSIQGILTIVAGVLLLLLIASFRLFVKSAQRLTVIVLLGLVTLPIVAGIFNFGPLKSLLYQETLSIRLHYWRVALRIIQDFPLFGVGIDRYGDFYRQYREQWFVEKYGPGLISTNAHNVALQWGTDLGILGLLAYLLMFAVATYFYLKNSALNTRRHLSDLDFVYVAFVAFYLQSLISISQLSVTVLGFALLGQLLAIARVARESESGVGRDRLIKEKAKGVRKASFVGLGTWWLLFVLALAPFTSSAVRFDLNLRNALQLPGAQQQVSDLSFRSDSIRNAAIPLLNDQDYAGTAIQNLFVNGRAEDGVELAKEAIARNPQSWTAQQALVQAYRSSGQFSEALDRAKIVLELDPLNYDLIYNIADLSFQIGSVQESREFAFTVLRQSPPGSEAHKLAEALVQRLR